MLLGMLLLCALHVPFFSTLERVRSTGARTIIVCKVYPDKMLLSIGKWEQKIGLSLTMNLT